MAKKKPYRFVLYALVRAVAAVIGRLPRRFLLALAGTLGQWGYWGISRQRERTLQNLRRAFGAEKSEAEIRTLAKGVFENLALTIAEIIRIGRLDPRELKDFVDVGDAESVYRSVLSEGKGLISVTAHIGNWELLAATFGSMGFRGGVLARRIYYEPYNRWIVGLRARLGVPTIYRDHASKEILRRLGSGEIIGMLPDQDIASLKGVFVDFFGIPAYTPTSPVKLALASGAPILTSFLIREPGNRYRVIVGDIIRPDITTTREEAVARFTGYWMESCERIIRRYPEQWAWMHNRWKTRPRRSRTRDFIMQGAS
ncbi:MAG: lysophospholipid acyltransferase family protein [Candidatus Omnitrophota bacterium]|nr:lysophospholipid acyltransferase family protein [Candidatus Omnitrophota bacterium]